MSLYDYQIIGFIVKNFLENYIEKILEKIKLGIYFMQFSKTDLILDYLIFNEFNKLIYYNASMLHLI